MSCEGLGEAFGSTRALNGISSISEFFKGLVGCFLSERIGAKPISESCLEEMTHPSFKSSIII